MAATIESFKKALLEIRSVINRNAFDNPDHPLEASLIYLIKALTQDELALNDKLRLIISCPPYFSGDIARLVRRPMMQDALRRLYEMAFELLIVNSHNVNEPERISNR